MHGMCDIIGGIEVGRHDFGIRGSLQGVEKNFVMVNIAIAIAIAIAIGMVMVRVMALLMFVLRGGCGGGCDGMEGSFRSSNINDGYWIG